MSKRKNLSFVSIVSLVLVIALLMPCTTSAAAVDVATPCASNYLSLYSAYVHVTSGGQVQVWFEVMGTDDMDEIGALSIML